MYGEKFYNDQVNGSLNSAKEVVKILLNNFKIQSVLDVGCGMGTWLSIFEKHGVTDICGIDGEWVDINNICIEKSKFIKKNLQKKFDLKRKFDLVISLEVAEHIEEEYSDNFIDVLTSHGNLILFSAAIPGQGGYKHINEQWHDYWSDKFKRKGYVQVDFIRNKIWNCENVEWWYEQNIYLYIREDELSKYKNIDNSVNLENAVHPDLYSLVLYERDKVCYELMNRLYNDELYEDIIRFEDIKNRSIFYYVGKSYVQLKKYSKAIEFLEQYCCIDESQLGRNERLSAMYYLALSYYEIGNEEKAKEYCEICINLTNGKHNEAQKLLNSIEIR